MSSEQAESPINSAIRLKISVHTTLNMKVWYRAEAKRTGRSLSNIIEHAMLTYRRNEMFKRRGENHG